MFREAFHCWQGLLREISSTFFRDANTQSVARPLRLAYHSRGTPGSGCPQNGLWEIGPIIMANVICSWLSLWLLASFTQAAGPAPSSVGAGESRSSASVSDSSNDPGAGDWQLETIQRDDGTVHQGLILAEREEEIELIEILRPPGKPMFAVIRPLRKNEIAKIQRLPAPERQRLIERVDSFRRRALVEAGRMEDIELRRASIPDGTRWIYEGAWFRLESTADEDLTRRSIVRIEQIFRAYRLVLPPGIDASNELLIELYGAMDEYRSEVDRLGLQIVHPAFFSASENRIVAGSDLNAYAQRLASAREHHARVRQKYRHLNQTFPNRLAAVLDKLRSQGYSEAEIELESRLRRSMWQRDYDAALARIDSVERRNQARFAEVTRQMFAMLYHEAFHAYVRNAVYPDPDQRLPRWLDEGLAQIFETAQLDGDTLRIDAPDPVRLRHLQLDLASEQPLAIAQLLDAADDRFLDSMANEEARRLYLYAWGLAYYLTYERDLLNRQRLDRYVANPDGLGSVARFIQMIEMPLPRFEAAWRTAMLDLRPYAAP